MTTPPTLDPEDQALFYLRKLLVKACGDAAFRQTLIDDPKAAAKQENINDLTDDDFAHLQWVQPMLVRFAKNTGVDPDDAHSWATGALLRRVVCPGVGAPPFQINVLSYQRFAFACAPDAGLRDLRAGSSTYKRSGS